MTASGRPAFKGAVSKSNALGHVGALLRRARSARRSRPTARAPRGRAAGRRRRSAGPRRAARARARVSSVSAALAITSHRLVRARARVARSPAAIASSALAIRARRSRSVARDVTSTTSGTAARRSPRRGTRAPSSPRCLSATPSAFQNAGTASTRLVSSRVTALKPIVTCLIASKSPPSCSTIACTNAGSDGSPETPTVRPSRSRGRAHVRLRDQRRQRLADERADRDEVAARLARDREVVDVEHAELDLPARHELERVRAGAGLADLQRVAGHVDRRVDRVGHEVERDRDRLRRRRRAVGDVVAAPDGEHGEQRRPGVSCGP